LVLYILGSANVLFGILKRILGTIDLVAQSISLVHKRRSRPPVKEGVRRCHVTARRGPTPPGAQISWPVLRKCWFLALTAPKHYPSTLFCLVALVSVCQVLANSRQHAMASNWHLSTSNALTRADEVIE